MSKKIINRAKMTVTGAAGTGDVTLNTAVSGYQTFTNAGLADGDTFPYVIEDGANWETGLGTYHSSGPSFTRTTVRNSSGGGTSKITATTNAIIYSSIMGEDMPSAGASTLATLTDVNVTEGAGIDGRYLKWDNGTSRWVASTVSASGPGTIPTYTPPTIAGLATVTHLGGGTQTDRTTGGVRSLAVHPGASDNNGELYCMLAAVPVGNWSACVRARVTSVAGTGSWNGAGLGVLNQTGSKGASIFRDDGPNSFIVTYPTGSGFTGGSPADSEAPTTVHEFQHIDWDGTNLTFSISDNGIDKVQVYQAAASTMIGGAPTHVGIMWGGAQTSASAPQYIFTHYYCGASGNGITLY